MSTVNPIPVGADHLKAYSGLLRLAVRLLAREVDTPLYRQMSNADGHSSKDHAPLIDPDLADTSEHHALVELATEYCRLFIGPQPACPPYASAHQGEVKLGGRAAHNIETFMARHSLHPVIAQQDAILEPDHLSVELALLAHLYSVAAGTTESDLTIEQAWTASHELLHTHIKPWAFSYLRDLETTAEYAPYTTIAHLVHRVLDEACAWPARTLTIPAEENTMVTVYSTTWCGYCDRLKKQLDRENIAYTEIDIETDPDAAQTVMNANDGNQVVPTVIFADGTAMTNPGVLQIKQHLATIA